MTEPEIQYPDDSEPRGWSKTTVDAEAVTAPQATEVETPAPVEITVTEPVEVPAPPNLTLNAIAPMATQATGTDTESQCVAFLTDVPDRCIVKVKDAKDFRVLQDLAARQGRRVSIVHRPDFQGRWKWQVVQEWQG